MDQKENNAGDPLQDLAQELQNYTPETASNITPSTDAAAADPVADASAAPSFTPSADLSATSTTSATPTTAPTDSDPLADINAALDLDVNPNPNSQIPKEKAKFEDLDEQPLKPADPVPGSIGSAKSYADFQAAQEKAAARAAKTAKPVAAKPAKPAFPSTPVQPNQFAQGPAPEPTPEVVMPEPDVPFTPPTTDAQPTTPVASTPTPTPAESTPVPPISTEPSPMMPQSTPAAPQKKSKTTLVLIIVLLAVIVIGGVVAALFMTGVIGAKTTSTTVTSFEPATPENATPANYTLICPASDDAITSSVTTVYKDDQMTEMSIVKADTYESIEQATEAETKFNAGDNEELTAIKNATEKFGLPAIQQTITRTDNTTLTTRIVTADFVNKLSEVNRGFVADADHISEEVDEDYQNRSLLSTVVSLLPLLADDEGNYLTDSESVQDYLGLAGYTCTTEYEAVE